MPRALIVAIPCARWIGLIGRDGGVPVEHINDRIAHVRQAWDLDPIIHRTGRSIIRLPLIRKRRAAGGIRGESDVIAVRVGDIPAIPGYQPVLPATCKFIRFPELAVLRIVNGKVAEQWDFADNWGANVQAGLIDPDKVTFKPTSACR